MMVQPILPHEFAAIIRRIASSQIQNARLALRVDPSPESFLLLRLARQVFPSRNLVALVAEHQQTGQNGRSGLNSTGGTTQLTEWLRKEGIERRFLSHTDSPSGFGPDGTCPDSERFDLAAALQECAIAKSSYLVIPTTLADQVDLLAYRIARQSGLGGLCGLQSSESVVPNASDARTVQVLRPFLELPEARLRASYEAHGVAPILSASSSDSVDHLQLPPEVTQADFASFASRMQAHNAQIKSQVRTIINQHTRQNFYTGVSTLSVDVNGPMKPDHWFANPFLAVRVINELVRYSTALSDPQPELGVLRRVHRSMLQHYMAPVEGASADLQQVMTVGGVLLAVKRNRQTFQKVWTFARQPPSRAELKTLTTETGFGEVVLWDNRFLIEIRRGKEFGRATVTGDGNQEATLASRLASARDRFTIRPVNMDDYNHLLSRLRRIPVRSDEENRQLRALNSYLRGMPVHTRFTLPAIAVANETGGDGLAFAIPALGVNLEPKLYDVGFMFVKRRMLAAKAT